MATHPLLILFAALTIAAPPAVPTGAGTEEAATEPVLLAMRAQAEALAPLMRTPLARRFLAATVALPPPPERTLYRDPNGAYLGESEVRSLSDSLRARLQVRVMDGRYFYQTRYGSPLNYARAIELAALDGLGSLEGARVLDFGYGRIGHLRLLASLGATVVGVDVDPLLRALYAGPGDQGPVPGFEGRGAGSLRLVHGSFPADADVRAAVGGDYSLIVSKNTLMGGHELQQRARQSQVVNLGVNDSTFVQELFQCMKPGGRFLIYNLASPQGNGRCPFTESLLRSAGFEVPAYDRDDSPSARAMLRAMGRDPASLDSVTATYTLARKPVPSR